MSLSARMPELGDLDATARPRLAQGVFTVEGRAEEGITGKHANTRIGEGTDDLQRPVGRGIVGDHHLIIRTQLGEDRLHLALDARDLPLHRGEQEAAVEEPGEAVAVGAALIWISHADNIVRLLSGTERKLDLSLLTRDHRP